MFGFGKPKASEIDRLFKEHGPRGDWAGLRKKLDAIDPRRLKGPELLRWHHSRGVVEFHAGNRDAAQAAFERGLQDFPRSGLLRFSLGQEHEFHGRIDEMTECFRGVKLEEVGGTYIMAMSRYFYLWDRLAEAQAAVEQLFDAYHRLVVIDPHFLYTRGMPLFSDAFGTLAAVVTLGGRPELAERELDHARRRLKDYIFDFDAGTLAAELHGDRRPLIDWADRQVAEMTRLKGPTGLHALLAAIHRARGQYSLSEALRLVNAVELTTRDIPWLFDLRLEYHAETAAAAEDLAEEARLLQAFFERQRLLFEPHHAFTFGFLKYQERLKPGYQRGRRGERAAP